MKKTLCLLLALLTAALLLAGCAARKDATTAENAADGIPQDLVGAAAQNHAGSFLGEVENDGLLHVMDGILRVGEGRV